MLRCILLGSQLGSFSRNTVAVLPQQTRLKGLYSDAPAPCCQEGPFRSVTHPAEHPHLRQLPIHTFVLLLRNFLARGWMDLCHAVFMCLGVADQADQQVPLIRQLFGGSWSFRPFCHIRERTQPLLAKILAEARQKEVPRRVLVCNPKHVPIIPACDSALGGCRGSVWPAHPPQ